MKSAWGFGNFFIICFRLLLNGLCRQSDGASDMISLTSFPSASSTASAVLRPKKRTENAQSTLRNKQYCDNPFSFILISLFCEFLIAHMYDDCQGDYKKSMFPLAVAAAGGFLLMHAGSIICFKTGCGVSNNLSGICLLETGAAFYRLKKKITVTDLRESITAALF